MKANVRALSEWYLRTARALPWRSAPWLGNPYAIWISEVMLQQTQVATVIPYFHRFLEKFPTVTALADALEQDVLTAWSGLGYYSRAKNLKKGAQYLNDTFQGKFPKDRDTILTVPGVGPYTAGAILSLAFDLPEALVDGNVQRVFARFFGVKESLQKKEVQTFFWDQAATWVKLADSPRIFNQALMELGATVCTKGAPKCEQCPLSPNCVARANGWQEDLPLKKVRKAKVDLWWISLVLESGDRLFLHQRTEGEWWAGLWDFAKLEVSNRKLLSSALSQFFRSQPGISANVLSWQELDHQKHTVTHHQIHLVPYLIRLAQPEFPGIEGLWVTRADIATLPLSSLGKKVLRAVTNAEATQGQMPLPSVLQLEDSI